VSETVAVIGLGYVGLPVALACAKHFTTIGFDIDAARIAELRSGVDRNGETDAAALNSNIAFAADPAALSKASFFIVAVPTPVDIDNRPDMRALLGACELVGKAMKPGACVVFESTVYPGLTEEVCGPLLAKVSGLREHADFTLGYSPERINPGDHEHALEKITKIVAGEDRATLERVAAVYERFVTVGVHRAESIRVAEAAKVIENTQRDLNIALMNELAIIFDKLGIRTHDVLRAAGTKWNFLRFTPGLVGGHCIGVDPYYLTTKAEQIGYQPQVILAGRRINNGMGAFVAQKCVKMLVEQDVRLKHARVGVLGLTFKENVSDLRNSRVPDIVRELASFGVKSFIHDPLADAGLAEHEYGLTLSPLSEFTQLDALILAVSHKEFLHAGAAPLLKMLAAGGVFIDVKSAFSPADFPRYWSL
jgi:UDP-N-acetyl-D-galactosamine dehydrogenase